MIESNACLLLSINIKYENRPISDIGESRGCFRRHL